MIKKIEEDIPLTEDLMREHGILNRVLLIYEEIIKKINNQDLPITALSKSVEIIKSFIEDYHERMEEDYLFPIFEKHKVQIRLVRTLKKQHSKGREITAKLQEMIFSKNYKKSEIKNLLKKFINMYRPHEAREDTILFPLVRSLISEKKFKELSEIFEQSEHKLFGEHGFESILHKVETIEKDLGIYKLENFTPKI